MNCYLCEKPLCGQFMIMRGQPISEDEAWHMTNPCPNASPPLGPYTPPLVPVCQKCEPLPQHGFAVFNTVAV
jgi:hypothetical protein